MVGGLTGLEEILADPDDIERIETFWSTSWNLRIMQWLSGGSDGAEDLSRLVRCIKGVILVYLMVFGLFQLAVDLVSILPWGLFWIRLVLLIPAIVFVMGFVRIGLPYFEG